MLSQVFSAWRRIWSNISPKRPLEDYSDDDDNYCDAEFDTISRRPPIKRSRYSPNGNQGIGCDDDSNLVQLPFVSISPLSIMTSLKQNTKENLSFRHQCELKKLSGSGVNLPGSSSNKENSSFLSSYKSNKRDDQFLETSAHIPTPNPQFLRQRLEKDITEADEFHDCFSSFKFKPSLTSTVGRITSLDTSVSKRKPIKSSRLSGTKTFGISPNLHGVYKGSSSIMRHMKKPSYLDRSSFFTRRPSVTAARECIRLEERDRYKELIQRYTTCGSILPSFKRDTLNFSLSSSDRKMPGSTCGMSAISQSLLDPRSTSRSRLKLEKSELSPTPSLSVPCTPSDVLPGVVSPSGKKLGSSSSIPVIDLSDETPAVVLEDDDIVIVKEISSPKPPRNSLEDKLKQSPFYHRDWLLSFQKYYRDKAKEREVDVESEAAAKKDCEDTRRRLQKCHDELMSKSMSRLDIKYPTKVVEVSDIEEEEELPELTREIQNVIHSAFKGGPPNVVLAEKFNIQITRRDIHTLSGLNWLNDEVINFYMNMLMERGKNDNFPSVYAFNTFFYSKLVKMGYSSVKRWTKKVDIFSYDILLVPVHLGMHWCLATIDFRDKCIRYYDSMLGNNNQCLEELRKYMHSEHEDKKKRPFDIGSLSAQNVKDIPQQMNGSDCGMFACKFAEYLSRNAPITFTQEHMPYFRRRMVYEIVTQRLM